MSDINQALHDLALGMMQMRELIAPVEETARGYRSELIQDHGWSEESADRMACEWYILVMRNMQEQVGKETKDEQTQSNQE